MKFPHYRPAAEIAAAIEEQYIHASKNGLSEKEIIQRIVPLYALEIENAKLHQMELHTAVLEKIATMLVYAIDHNVLKS